MMREEDLKAAVLELNAPDFCPLYASAAARDLYYSRKAGTTKTCGRDTCRNGCERHAFERDATLAVEAVAVRHGRSLQEAKHMFQRILDQIRRNPKGPHNPGRDALLLKWYYGEETVGGFARFISTSFPDLFGWAHIKDPERRMETIDKHIRRLLKANGIKTKTPRGRPRSASPLR
jgi:hypothetical protein